MALCRLGSLQTPDSLSWRLCLLLPLKAEHSPPRALPAPPVTVTIWVLKWASLPPCLRARQPGPRVMPWEHFHLSQPVLAIELASCRELLGYFKLLVFKNSCWALISLDLHTCWKALGSFPDSHQAVQWQPLRPLWSKSGRCFSCTSCSTCFPGCLSKQTHNAQQHVSSSIETICLLLSANKQAFQQGFFWAQQAHLECLEFEENSGVSLVGKPQ